MCGLISTQRVARVDGQTSGEFYLLGETKRLGALNQEALNFRMIFDKLLCFIGYIVHDLAAVGPVLAKPPFGIGRPIPT